MAFKEDTESILKSILLALQLCLGFWQFLHLTPLGALIRSVVAWLLLPLGLSPTYAKVRHCPGRIFKGPVQIAVLSAVSEQVVPTKPRSDAILVLKSSYLSVDFELERRGENKLFLNKKMLYYISDTIWQKLQVMTEHFENVVFVKGNKEFWLEVVTGGVMSLEEVLDCLILENQVMTILEEEVLLPVNLCVSEEKLLKILNLVALILQIKEVYWVIPTLLSATSAVLEFNVRWREFVYDQINLVFCYTMHLLCDKLPYVKRRQVYSLGKWVQNLKPCNDIKLKIVKGDACIVIGGGAKTRREDAVYVPPPSELPAEQSRISFKCGQIKMTCWKEERTCLFYGYHMSAKVRVVTGRVNCNSMDEFRRTIIFINFILEKGSGSLISYVSKKKVHVRGLKESILCYAKSGFPPLYELKLEHVTINGL